jgi:hypothetical protein
MSYYRVRIDVGPYSWHIARGDAPDYGPTDGLEIRWAFTEGESRPQQPTPVQAAFGVVVENADDFYVDIGDPVSIAVFTDPVGTPPPPTPFGYLPPIATFAGRITDLDPTPHDLGTVFRVQAVDYLADLIALQGKEFGGEPTRIAQQNPPGSADNYSLNYSLRDFIVALADRNGLPNPFPYYPSYPPDDWTIWALQTLGTGLDSMFNHYRRALLSYLMRGSDAVGTSQGLAGVIVDQVNWDTATWTAEPDADMPHAIQFIPRERRTWLPGGIPPGMLTDGPGALIEIDTADMPVMPGFTLTAPMIGVIEAGMVEFDSASWRRSKSQAVDTSELGWRGAGDGLGNGGETHVYRHANSPDAVPVVRSIGDVHAYNVPDGQIRALARFHCPEVGEGSARFQADAFRVRPALGDPWVMSCAGYRLLTQPYSALLNPIIAIRDIPAKWNPNSSSPTYYAGSLVGTKFVIQDGDYYMDLSLDNVVPRPTFDPSAGVPNTYESFATYKARAIVTKFEDVSPSVSFESARIIRRRD